MNRNPSAPVIIYCKDCNKPVMAVNLKRKLCPDCRKERTRASSRLRWKRYREDRDAVPGYRDNREKYQHTDEVKRLNRKMDAGHYKVIGGPEVVADFIEIGSMFGYCDVRNGIINKWLPNGTILERDGVKFIIQQGKKVRMMENG